VELTTIDNPKPPAECAFDRDLALVYSTRSGDISAFEELVRKYDRKLFRIAQNVTHNTEDSEEVVQSAFFKAYQNLGRFQGDAKFSTWLIRIALNEALMKLRKQRARREQSMDSGPQAEDESSNFASRNRLPIDVTDWAPNPEALHSSVEIRDILMKGLEKLTPALRVVFVLRDIEGHSIAETSEMLGLTETAVKTRLSRSRMQLREELSGYFKRRD
jgi:RNA polymerase sigma-70 factor (ECF subfamily)